MTRQEGPFQFLQLPTVEVSPASSPLVAALIRFPVATCKEEHIFRKKINRLERKVKLLHKYKCLKSRGSNWSLRWDSRDRRQRDLTSSSIIFNIKDNGAPRQNSAFNPSSPNWVWRTLCEYSFLAILCLQTQFLFFLIGSCLSSLLDCQVSISYLMS